MSPCHRSTCAARILAHVDTEIANAEAGRPAQIWAKLNSLVDPEIIEALYRASQAGVQIDLVVRGICCLRPGVPGLSEHIRVQEHRRPVPRAFTDRLLCQWVAIAPPGRPSVYILSRLDAAETSTAASETLVPVLNETVHAQILDQIMVANFRDNQQSWNCKPAETGLRVEPDAGEKPFDAHTYFMNNPSLSGRGKSLKDSEPPSFADYQLP